jgi:TRAP-type C4-dicarboxylate transport system permease small subunit
MMKMVLALDAGWRFLTAVGIAVSSFLIMLIAVLIAADVASTELFRSPVPVVTELSSVTLAVIIFFALAFAQHSRANVEVDIVLVLLPKRARYLLRVFALLIGTAFFLLLAWRTLALALTSVESRETAMALVAFPVYPFKIAMAIGAVIAAGEFARQLVWLVVKDDERVTKIEDSVEAKI